MIPAASFISKIWGSLCLSSRSFLAYLASFHIFLGSREALGTAALYPIVFAFLIWAFFKLMVFGYSIQLFSVPRFFPSLLAIRVSFNASEH